MARRAKRARRLGLGLALCFVASAAQSGTAPDDVPGWDAARWGMTRAQLEEAFGDRVNVLSGRWLYGGAYAELSVTEVLVGDLTFAAYLQMDRENDRLRQVLLERRRVGATPAIFERLIDGLEETYGEPSQICAQDQTGGQPLDYQLIWRFPTTTIHVKFLDFSTTAVFSRDPQAGFDPLIPERAVRRNLRRFMPRRILMRYHDSKASDLDRGCS